jgi:3,4-dihydroxy 2-butanone 4-phosphate synthase/GTP cyclohydrolase II
MFCSLDEALEDFRRGKFLVLVDAENREDEGDLITAAQFITAEKVNLMLAEARGMFLFPAPEELWRQLDIPLIQPRHGDAKTPRFGLPFDARRGISTGISAGDRAYTVRAALEPGAGPDDFAIPGHVLPLAARAGGLTERQGHTEGAVELARRAGLASAAVMSEVLTPEGQMARGGQLQAFAARLGCGILAIEQLLASH